MATVVGSPWDTWDSTLFACDSLYPKTRPLTHRTNLLSLFFFRVLHVFPLPFFFFFLVPCPLERFSPFPTLCSLFLFSWRESHCFTLYIRCPSRVIRLSVVDGHKRFQRFHDPPMVARSDNYWPRATLLK